MDRGLGLFRALATHIHTDSRRSGSTRKSSGRVALARESETTAGAWTCEVALFHGARSNDVDRRLDDACHDAPLA